MLQGHKYTDKLTGCDMVEFHIDSHPHFFDRVSHKESGGLLSVRKPLGCNPLVCFGQDECIFKQYCFMTKSWTAPDGQKVVIPKDEGAGLMISAFVSREFGFGMALTEANLEKVNRAREGKSYSDELAATTVEGKATKEKLKDLPFIIEFEYGNKAQGYWEYDCMVL